jgi:hypothetical protein
MRGGKKDDSGFFSDLGKVIFVCRKLCGFPMAGEKKKARINGLLNCRIRELRNLLKILFPLASKSRHFSSSLRCSRNNVCGQLAIAASSYICQAGEQREER